jgi:hypothetical protein
VKYAFLFFFFFKVKYAFLLVQNLTDGAGPKDGVNYSILLTKQSVENFFPC